MKKPLFITSLLVLTFSCTRKDEKFCNCLTKSDELNVINQLILNGKTDKNTLVKAIDLKNEKLKICEDYVNMDGKQMLELKKVCIK